MKSDITDIISVIFAVRCCSRIDGRLKIAKNFFIFQTKGLTTLMRKVFCNKCHNLFYIDSRMLLSRYRRAQQYEVSVELASTLKNNSHPQRRLTDMLDTFSEFSDNA